MENKNTRDRSTGYWSAGSWLTGYWPTGNQSTGYGSTGYGSTGNGSTGYWPICYETLGEGLDERWKYGAPSPYSLKVWVSNTIHEDRLAHKTAMLEAIEGQREPATSQEEFEEKWLDVVITRANFIEFTRDAKKISRQITLDTMTAIINKIYE